MASAIFGVRLFAALILVLAISSAVVAQEQLSGCDDPKATAELLRRLNLTTADWHMINELRLVDVWRRVFLPLGAPGLILATGDRIIHGETQCGIEFLMRSSGDVRSKEIEDLDEVRVIYSNARREVVVSASELLRREWSPPQGTTEVYDSGREAWNSLRRNNKEGTVSYEWHIQGEKAVNVKRVTTRLFRSREAWTTSVRFESIAIPR